MLYKGHLRSHSASSCPEKDIMAYYYMEVFLLQKYHQPLKSPDNAGLLDAFLVDEIFYQVPGILNVHQVFLEQLRRRLEQWDLQQKVGDVFLDVVRTKINYIAGLIVIATNECKNRVPVRAYCRTFCSPIKLRPA